MSENRTPAQGGCGIGLRFAHVEQVLRERPAIPWLEVITDNFLHAGAVQQDYLHEIAAQYPLSFHCVGMSLGSAEALDRDYFRQLRTLMDAVQPLRISDHLCWTAFGGAHSHDLLPLPYTSATIRHLADRIWVQDWLGRELVVENVSSYLEYRDSVMPEWEFVTAVLEQADCGLLLDVNNIYVSARNHGFSAADYLTALPMQRVREIHLAGYSDRGTHLLDTHSAPVSAPVWDLYREAVRRTGALPTLIEWDNNLPALETLLAEAAKADVIMGTAYA